MSASEHRVHIIYDVPGWAYHHRAEALAARAPPGFRVSCATDLIEDELPSVDLVVLLDCFRAEQIADRIAGHDIALLGGVNVGWPQQQAQVLQQYEYCDALLFNNRGYHRAFTQRYPDRVRTYQISNGVDTSVFRSRGPVEARPPRVLWTGSKIAAQNKGYELLRELEPAIHARGLELDMRLVDSMCAPWTPAQMAAWYHQGQILLVASHTEGTPNPALEAAACGNVVVSTAVGNMPELIVEGVNGIVIERTPASILAGLDRARARLGPLSRAMAGPIASWSWDRRAPTFFELFAALIDAR